MTENNPWEDLINQIKDDGNETGTDNKLGLTDLNEEFKIGSQNYSLNEEQENKCKEK